MKQQFKHIIYIFILCSLMQASNHGFYIYKFFINSDNQISLENSKYIDSELKISQIKKHNHDSLIYKVRNNKGVILFEGEVANPRIIHSEYLLGNEPSKDKIILENSYFIVKVPALPGIHMINFSNAYDENIFTDRIRLDNIENTIVRDIFPLTDVMVNGNNDSRINIVFVGDGYRQDEMNNYISDVNDVTNALFNTEPYFNYMNYFNVYAIQVPSNETGTDHPNTAPDCGNYNSNVFYADTYFDTSFDLYNIHRLLYVQDNSALYDVLSDNTPFWDIAFVMVNTSMYGGAGGPFAVFSRHSDSNEIAIHEIGHSFAGLSDEYWAGFQYANENANMTQNINPETTTWNLWLDYNETGIYSYEPPGTEWYRPHQNCKMRYLGPPFCSICKEQTIKSIYSIIDHVDSFYPENTDLIISSSGIEYFSISPIFNIPNTIEIEWFFNENLIAQDVLNIEFESLLYPTGNHQIKAIIKDISNLVRNDPNNLLESQLIWNITIESNNFIGDLNIDGSIDVIDIILAVQLILNLQYNNVADLNSDEIIDILDVIIIINLILE